MLKSRKWMLALASMALAACAQSSPPPPPVVVDTTDALDLAEDVLDVIVNNVVAAAR